jgi:crotonobetainyl-CoA:carnitine CoA-transferase CaiB-like acyl-CoA transferase
MAQGSSEGAGPLAGVTVLEAAAAAGARYCGRLLSVLGAEVVRIGPAPAPGDPGQAAFGAWLDEGKAEADGFAAGLARLGRAPDLVVAGQTPAQVAATDAELRARGLAPLRLGLTWFGETGPYAGWSGDDALIQALTGLAAGFGAADGPPMLPQGRAPQLIGGATLFLAGLAALWGGGADRVDVSVLEATLCFSEIAPAGFERTGGRARRTGVNRSSANHPMSVYATQDGWIGVTALTPAQWTALAQLVGRPAWATDARFATSVGRVAHADALDAELSAIFRTRPSAAWLEAGQAARIPMAPVPTHAELLRTPHWVERGSFSPVPGTRAQGPRLPFRTAFDGRPSPAPAPGRGAPLAGLRVIDFSMGWAGPLCTRHLADLGAEVVKIESADHYDWWRGWEPPGASDPPEYEMKVPFNVMNRGKRSVLIDLTTPEGQAQAKTLVAGADVVIENYAPGVMAKLGLSYDVLRTVRPGLVMVSMGAFGAVGPWRGFRAYGATVEQASGMPHANGLAAWPPVLQHGAYGDPVAGIYGAVAAVAALAGRARLGGSWSDLAQVECLFQLGADAILSAQVAGPPPRLGSRSAAGGVRCLVPARGDDAYFAVAAVDAGAWTALCGVLGRADWAADPALASPAGRLARADEIEAALAAWAAGLKAGEAAARLQAAGVPAAPLVRSDQLATEPQLVASGAWLRLARRHSGAELMGAPPYRLDGARPAVSRPSPLLGEHTAEVLDGLRPAEGLA